ncbi:MAG TPA: heparin lyase I family protein [Opitutaceae bacterium]|nr:heparin lyase I family protein [Opitutaceae bacterium]
MTKKLVPLLAFVSMAAVSSYGTVIFQNNGTKEGWPNYPQKPEAKGTITDVSSPVYHSTSSIKFTQTFIKGYTGRYHSEVDMESASNTGLDRYFGMTVYLPAGWVYAMDQVNIQQWAGTGPWIIMRVNGPDLMVLFDHLPGLNGEPHIYHNMPIATWTRIVTHIHSVASGGIFEVWVNGNKVLSQKGDFVAPGNGGAIRWSTGCYVSGWFQKSAPQGPSTRIVYGTHYRVASSYAEAEPANW